VETFRCDLQLAFRLLAKKPAFTAVAVLTLALGIAINSAMYSLVSAFLLRSPSAHDPKHVVVVSSVNPSQVFHADTYRVSVPNYFDWRAANQTFENMAAADESRTTSLSTRGQSEALRSAAVSSNYFTVLGVSPQLGRAFLSGEDQLGNDHVAILSHELWERQFGSDKSIVGRTVRLDRETYTVIGVMPEDFQLLGFTPQLWTPLVLTPGDRSAAARKNRTLHLFARLRPEATLKQARAEMSALAKDAERADPETEKGWGVSVRTLPDFLVYDFEIRTALALMMTTVGFVLLIACANVAGLLLARAAGRRRELAIRMSLGAGRMRIVRQVLTEGLVIAITGGCIGLLLAYWGIGLVRANMTFNEATSAVPIRLDGNVLLFAFGVSVLSAVLSSLAPALTASRTDINTSLKDESRSASTSRSKSRLRTILVAGEIALALFLLIGAGLLGREIFLIEHQNLGFGTAGLLTASVTLDPARYPDAAHQAGFVRDVILRFEHIPGIETTAATSDLPATGAENVNLRINGQPDLPANRRLSVLRVVVTSNYFKTAEIPLLHGRAFTDMDNEVKPRVVIVNQEFIRRHLQDREPLGKLIRLNDSAAQSQWSEIVGVVGNVKTYSEGTREEPEVYEPFLQHPLSSFSFMLRTSSNPASFASALRQTVAQIDPELPLVRVMSMPAVIERQRGGDQFFVGALGTFAVLALVLAAIGIYGLIAYSVSQRMHEIGIRIALGARNSQVQGMVLGEGLRMAIIGVVIGLALALPLPKLFDAIFYDLHLREPRLFIFMPLLILGVALLSTYVPALRATRENPISALRQE
jgi:putative ABC transport system permease protein